MHAGGAVVGGSELCRPQNIDLMALLEVAKHLLAFRSHWHCHRLSHSASLRPMPFGGQLIQDLRPGASDLDQHLDELRRRSGGFANRVPPDDGDTAGTRGLIVASSEHPGQAHQWPGADAGI